MTPSSLSPRFAPGWKITIFVLLLLPLLVSLGFWQLSRAEEKRLLLNDIAARESAAPKLFEPRQSYADFTPISVTGRYTGEHFLLDNQVVNGRVGYDVLSVLRTTSGSVVLVNRGFIGGNVDRAVLPEIDTTSAVITVSGAVARNLGQPFALATDSMDVTAFLATGVVVLQTFAPTLIAQYFPNETVGDWFLRLDDGQPSGFAYHYVPVRVLPAKHTAYAVQWFAMAVALIVIYILLGLGKLRPAAPLQQVRANDDD